MLIAQPPLESEYVEDSVDYSTYNTALVRLAESGDLWAQYCLGEIYEFGKGTQVNFEQMARWYIAAANHPEAYYHAASPQQDGATKPGLASPKTLQKPCESCKGKGWW